MFGRAVIECIRREYVLESRLGFALYDWRSLNRMDDVAIHALPLHLTDARTFLQSQPLESI